MKENYYLIEKDCNDKITIHHLSYDKSTYVDDGEYDSFEAMVEEQNMESCHEVEQQFGQALIVTEEQFKSIQAFK